MVASYGPTAANPQQMIQQFNTLRRTGHRRTETHTHYAKPGTNNKRGGKLMDYSYERFRDNLDWEMMEKRNPLDVLMGARLHLWQKYTMVMYKPVAKIRWRYKSVREAHDIIDQIIGGWDAQTR